MSRTQELLLKHHRPFVADQDENTRDALQRLDEENYHKASIDPRARLLMDAFMAVNTAAYHGTSFGLGSLALDILDRLDNLDNDNPERN